MGVVEGATRCVAAVGTKHCVLGALVRVAVHLVSTHLGTGILRGRERGRGLAREMPNAELSQRKTRERERTHRVTDRDRPSCSKGDVGPGTVGTHANNGKRAMIKKEKKKYAR